MSKHLSQDEFFINLENLLAAQSSSLRGSIFLTQKTVSIPLPSHSSPSKSSGTPGNTNTTKVPAPGLSPILIRASNGRHGTVKVKASTIVQLNELDAFYTRYAEICKAGMVGLKKRDRSGKKKGRAKGKIAK